MMNLVPISAVSNAGPRVNVIRLSGAIVTRQGGLSDAALAPIIQRAFTKGKPSAVALSVNSPGGSPVQTSLIASRIERLSKERGVPVFAFVEDVAASGGYWLSCAASEIYVDHSSIVGSVGVISEGFGFDKFIAKHGIERRVYTSGISKNQLDPFSSENPVDIAHLKSLQRGMHKSFISYVRTSRGNRLSEGSGLLDGSFWTGAKAVDLGLADGVGHLVPTMKDRFGQDTRFSVYEPKPPLLRRLGAQIIDGMMGGFTERTMWAKYGL